MTSDISGEQCNLRAIHDASNQKTIWEGDIPSQCRDCIQFQIDKNFVQLNLEFFGLVDVTVEPRPEKTYRVGGRAPDVHGREIVFEKLEPSETERTRHYEPFHCNRPSLSAFSKKKEVTVTTSPKYL